MNLRKKLAAPLVIAVAAVCGCVPAASASVFIGPEELLYTGAIEAASEGSHVVLSGSNGIKTECSSSLKGSVESQGSEVTAEGKLSSLSFSGCTNGSAVHVKSAGTLIAHATSADDGTLTSTGAEVEVTANTIFGTISCIYTTSATDFGTFTGSATTSGNATIDVSATVPRTGGNFLCGSTGTWTGSYKVSAPSTLGMAQGPTHFHVGLGANDIKFIGLQDSAAQTFTFDYGTIACAKVTTVDLLTTTKFRSAFIPLLPAYTDCTFGAEKPAIQMKSCGYLANADAIVKGDNEGSTSIYCVTKTDSIEIPTKDCLITIPEQQTAVGDPGLKAVTFKDVIKPPLKREVTIEINLTGLKYIEDGAKCVDNGKTKTNGKFAGNILIAGQEPKGVNQYDVLLAATR
jgi:hypothetical protein